MPKVLVTASHYDVLCVEAKKMLEDKGFQVIQGDGNMPYFSFEELSKIVPDLDAAIVGLDDWTDAVFALAPKLKVVAKFGVGVDNIDLEAAKKRGIKVINARGQNSNAVAELAVGFMIDALRNVSGQYSKLLEGEWMRFLGREIKGKTVGLLGFGDIARKVAKKLSGFDVNIIAYDLFPNETLARELGVEMVSKNEVLKLSDIVSIHIPNTPENYHTMNDEAFAMMKEGAYFINTARGALVDADALCRAVKSGHLSGAATDVYEKEPLKKDDRLLKTDNIICTPHTGAETYDAYVAVSLNTAQGVIDAIEGREPINWLNK